MTITRRAALSAAVLLPPLAAPALAQPWPGRPIRVTVLVHETSIRLA